LDFAYLVWPPYQAGLSSFVTFVSFCSRLDCTGRDKPRRSANELRVMAVEIEFRWRVH
jgi:hypothetical protein